MQKITVTAASGKITCNVMLPASKSISNRLLIIRHLSGVDFPISNLSEADDTKLLLHLLNIIETLPAGSSPIELNSQNAGTVLRFLTAFLAMKPGTWILTGTDRMMLRPVGVLVEALVKMGASIEYLSSTGYPPLVITGTCLSSTHLTIDAGISSQFISALMMIAPILPEGLTVGFNKPPVSMPYIEMTGAILRDFGIHVEISEKKVVIGHGSFKPIRYRVEPDWSAAAFWYEIAALSPEAEISVAGLSEKSIQGDALAADIFSELGVKTTYTADGIILSRIPARVKEFQFDFSNYPDLAPAVITTCAALGIKGDFSGLEGLKIKESDRLYALEHELPHLKDEKRCDPPLFKTYHDHRLAMAFAPLALPFRQVAIENPSVVTKSFPGFWRELEKAGFELTVSD
jgi:3-phosphoshikimate 1-carboxyvinyltransferase